MVVRILCKSSFATDVNAKHTLLIVIYANSLIIIVISPPTRRFDI